MLVWCRMGLSASLILSQTAIPSSHGRRNKRQLLNQGVSKCNSVPQPVHCWHEIDCSWS